jgi:hypothetical protein
MRLRSFVVIVGLLFGCARPAEWRGLYVHDDGAGAFVPCERPTTLLHVNDPGLAARYRREATTPYEVLFVRLRGVRADSGSIHGGPHYLRVEQVLEMRARDAGECPNVARPLSSLLP